MLTTSVVRGFKSCVARFLQARGELSLVLLLCFLTAQAQPAFAAAQCTNTSTAGNASSWTRWECLLEVQGVGSVLAGRNPYLMKLKVSVTAVNQQTRTGYAFWDGLVPGTTNTHRFLLRMQFPPSAVGPTTWTWSTSCETPTYCSSDTTKTNPSLVSSGTVSVSNYSGANPLYQGGPIRILSNNFYPLPELYQGNNRFNWIGDAAWAAPMRASAAEWDAYIENRRSATNPTGTNSANARILHIGPAPDWAGFVPDANNPSRIVDRSGNPPFDSVAGCTSNNVVPNACSMPNLAFWRAFEDKVDKANQKGLYLFLAGLMEPYKRYPASDEAVRFACWLVARLSGNFVIFSPGFDSPPNNVNVTALQKAVGSAIKATAPQHLVTNHWSTDDNFDATITKMSDLHKETWLDFEMYQSGYMNGNESEIAKRARELAQVIAGHTNLYPFNTTRKAVINGEAVYDEGGTSSNGRPAFRAYRARQAGYLSWLAGAGGYTHGTGGLWDWGACGGATPNACGYQMPLGFRTYSDAMKPIGQSFKNVKCMGEALRRSATDQMISTEQWRIENQATSETKKMVVARTRDWMIAYLPHDDKIQLNHTVSGASGSTAMNTNTGRLWNPANGTFDANSPSVTCPVGGISCTWINEGFRALNPDVSDRLLVLTPGPANTWFQTNPNQLEVINGRFDEAEPQGIHGQLLAPNGSPTGGRFLIFSAEGQEPTSPAVGRDGKGQFLVVWATDSDGDSLSEIWGKWIEEGTTRFPPAFRISPADGSEHFQPSVSIAGVSVPLGGPTAVNAARQLTFGGRWSF